MDASDTALSSSESSELAAEPAAAEAARRAQRRLAALLAARDDAAFAAAVAAAPPRAIATRDPDGLTLLYRAAMAARTAAVHALLRANAPVRARCGRANDTPLAKAAWQGKLPLLDALLAAGADPRAVDVLGQSPLHSGV